MQCTGCAVLSPMPDGSLSTGPYSTPPAADDERITLAIQRDRPEEIFGLSWNKPDFAASGHKIVRTFSVERKKRPGGEFIPCAICSGKHPKFLDGAVLWSPDRWLRVIGHVCAAKPEHFGERIYGQLRKQRKQEQLDNAAFDWLHANISPLQAVCSDLVELERYAKYFEEQQRIFFRDVPDLAKLLESTVRRHQGVLTVSQRISEMRVAAMKDASRGSMQSLHEVVNVGSLLGPDFLIRPTSKRSHHLGDIAQTIKNLPSGAPDEIMLALIDKDEHQINIFAGLALRSVQRAVKIAEECFRAEQFLGAENLTVLENWGKELRNPTQFSVQRFRSGVRFILQDRSQATLSTDWPEKIDLSLLKSIAVAGIHFSSLMPRATDKEDAANLL